MTTRACDFSSFKRPPRPIPLTSTNESPQSTYERSVANDNSQKFSTTPRPSDHNPVRNMSMRSIDPNSSVNRKYGRTGGSFEGSNSSGLGSFSPAPITTFSAKNSDNYSNDGRQGSINQSTIDRRTLPYERQTSTVTPHSDTLQKIDGGSGSGSGLVFVDGGRRGVMSANSQHSLEGSLSGHRIDRSLSNRQNSTVEESFDGGYNTQPRHAQYDSSSLYHTGASYHTGQYPQNANHYLDNSDDAYAQQGFSLPNNHMGGTPHVVYSNIHDTRQDSVIRPRTSPHNVSSGESGIAGCEFNTLGGVPYDLYAAGAAPNYIAAVPHNGERYADGRMVPSSNSVLHSGGQLDENTGRYDTQPRNNARLTAVSQASNSDSNATSNTAESSLNARGEYNQQTLLLPAGSAIRLNTSADENSVTIFDQNPSFSFPNTYQQRQNSVPKISTRSSSRASYGKGLKFFKKGKKRQDQRTDDIYRGNNLYVSGDKDRANFKSVLGVDGPASAGFNSFNSKYSSMKRPFCPRWQCVVLAVVIGISIFLSLGLVVYFYVWPSVLQPLVESSQPVDGQWGSWKPWFECSVTCGTGVQNRTRECNSPSAEDGGKECEGLKYEIQRCKAPVECPDCSRVCDVGTLSKDCRSCTCEGHMITGRITDEFGDPLSGVKVYKGSGATLLLSGTDSNGEFQFEGICSNGDNELRLEKEMYRISRVYPTQSESDEKSGFVSFAMIRLFLPNFTISPSNEQRLEGQKVTLCCEAESEQPPTAYIWYKDNSRLDATVYAYSLQSPSLNLPNLMEWDGGIYTCEVYNEAGSVMSDPATLTVYKNWTDLCDPKPKDKFVPLPDGCSQETFNTGTCLNENHVLIGAATTGAAKGEPQCVAPGQYPSDGVNNVCLADAENQPRQPLYCCKPVQEEEVAFACTLKDFSYNMALKRVISCGCVLCN